MKEGIAPDLNYVKFLKKGKELVNIGRDEQWKVIIHKFEGISMPKSNSNPLNGKKDATKLSTDKEFTTKAAGLDPPEKVRKETARAMIGFD